MFLTALITILAIIWLPLAIKAMIELRKTNKFLDSLPKD